MKEILLEIDDNTFCISDTHFNHKGVLNFEPCRLKDMQLKGYGLNAKTDEELNTAHTQWIIDNWNKTVKPDDIIIHFGDLAWKGHREILPLLNGRKILILGNHDKKGPNTYNDFEYVVRGNVKVENNLIYIAEDDDKLMSTLEIKIDDKKFLLSHYPATAFEYRFKITDEGKIWETPTNLRIDKIIKIMKYIKADLNIHGHTHSLSYTKKNNWFFSNVSLENIDFKPIKIKDLKWS